MPKYRSMPPVYTGFEPLPLYEGEMLSSILRRAKETGFSDIDAASVSYDDLPDDDFTVDPTTDIRFNRFEHAEYLSVEHSRAAANALQESAIAAQASIVSDVPSVDVDSGSITPPVSESSSE